MWAAVVFALAPRPWRTLTDGPARAGFELMKLEGANAFDGQRWSPDEAEDALRAHGCRVTQSRVAVLRALLELGGTIDAVRLTERAQQYEPGIHQATVYRTVNVLSEVGIASHVHAGHGPSLVRLAGDERLVAVCQVCGAIEPVPPASVQRLVADTARASGFVLEPGHFALEGVCAHCSGGET
jgi:Fur family ferric uptake transcriptional regulator